MSQPSIKVGCQEGFDGGLPQTFLLQVGLTNPWTFLGFKDPWISGILDQFQGILENPLYVW